MWGKDTVHACVCTCVSQHWIGEPWCKRECDCPVLQGQMTMDSGGEGGGGLEKYGSHCGFGASLLFVWMVSHCCGLETLEQEVRDCGPLRQSQAGPWTHPDCGWMDIVGKGTMHLCMSEIRASQDLRACWGQGTDPFTMAFLCAGQGGRVSSSRGGGWGDSLETQSLRSKKLRVFVDHLNSPRRLWGLESWE